MEGSRIFPVRKLIPERVKFACEILADAFLDDPYYVGSYIREDVRRDRIVEAFIHYFDHVSVLHS